MIQLTNPSADEFRDAIAKEGGNVISEGWMKSAWDAVNTWIGGSVNSSPYSYMGQRHIELPLQIIWQWDNGTIKVVVFRG
jgi:hypothetical protein